MRAHSLALREHQAEILVAYGLSRADVDAIARALEASDAAATSRRLPDEWFTTARELGELFHRLDAKRLAHMLDVLDDRQRQIAFAAGEHVHRARWDRRFAAANRALLVLVTLAAIALFAIATVRAAIAPPRRLFVHGIEVRP